MISRVCGCLLFLLLLASQAAGQKAYENTEYGFSFKPPSKDWSAIPTPPNEELVIVRFQSKREQVARRQPVHKNPDLDVIVFERVSVTGAESPQEKAEREMRKKMGLSFDSFTDWLARMMPNAPEAERRSFGKTEVDEYQITTSQFGPASFTVPCHLSLYVFRESNLEVLMMFSCLEDHAEKTVKREFEKCARSFQWIERVKEDESALEGMTEQERFLHDQIAKLPDGWSHRWSPQERYLLLYDADEDFVIKLGAHLEAMRDHYESIFPPDKPIEAVSIARVCKDQDTYLGYGAPRGSGGYWSSRDKELVVYNNQAMDRNATFLVISHEGFHQYIYYYYGELAPHSWYNEGHGDYFGGAELTRSGKKVLKISPLNHTNYPRLSMAKEAIRTGSYPPLKEFMNWTQAQYYSGDIGTHYALGWSLIWFLMEGKNEGVRMDPKWLSLRDEYLKNLVAARDELRALDSQNPFGPDERAVQSKAYDLTFADWTDEDWKEFQDAWVGFYD